jgi:hypothetical protein
VKVVINACGSKVRWLKIIKKIVLTVKQKPELLGKFEIGESAAELAKDYEVGTE